MKTLSDAHSGETVKLKALPKGTLRTQLVRLGIYEGMTVECLQRLPGGTVVIRNGRSQVGIGRLLAEAIHVAPVEEQS
jgi:ferrous iron transport protein A